LVDYFPYFIRPEVVSQPVFSRGMPGNFRLQNKFGTALQFNLSFDFGVVEKKPDVSRHPAN
jgi:hypothetical protein